MRTGRPAAVACAIALGFGAVDYDTEEKRWWAHIQYLASDALEGDTGSEGYRKAAAYVADEFKQFGLKPAGTSGYYQPVKFEVDRIIDEILHLLTVLANDPKRPEMSQTEVCATSD